MLRTRWYPAYILPVLFEWIAIVAIEGAWACALLRNERDVVGKPLPGGADFSRQSFNL